MNCDTPDRAKLPSLVLPCPRCGQRMIANSIELPDRITHACQSCQIEVSRALGNTVPHTQAA